MRIHTGRCCAVTGPAPGFVDITDQVQAVVARSGIPDGRVTVAAADDGCTVVLNEHESGLLTDICTALRRLGSETPQQHRALVGSGAAVLPAAAGDLRLGTWQRVLLIELRGAAERVVTVQVIGD